MVKWLTAFGTEELTMSISAGKEEALRDIPILAQMNTTEIDEVLAEALQKKQDRIPKRSPRAPNRVGGRDFRGYLARNRILINDQLVSLEFIRNVQILQEKKWFQIHVFTSNRMQYSERIPFQ